MQRGSERRKKSAPILAHRLRARDAEYGFDQVGRRYRSCRRLSQQSPYWSFAPHFGHVALDEAVRQEHALDRVVELLDRLPR